MFPSYVTMSSPGYPIGRRGKHQIVVALRFVLQGEPSRVTGTGSQERGRNGIPLRPQAEYRKCDAAMVESSVGAASTTQFPIFRTTECRSVAGLRNCKP